MNITLSPENVEFLRGPAEGLAKRLDITIEEAISQHADAVVSTWRKWKGFSDQLPKIIPADDSNDTVEPETVPCDRCEGDCTGLNAKIGTCPECLGDRGE